MPSQSLDELLANIDDSKLLKLAEQARRLTRQRFGANIELYTPIYLSNYCANRCSYCSFSADNLVARTKLSDEQLAREIALIKARGIDHVLIVTGEHPKQANISHFLRWLGQLKQHFNSVSIECQQLSLAQYQQLTQAGLDGVYLYQETYNEQTYRRVHLSGFKKDYHRRLQAPFDMANAGVRRIGLGILLGLHDNWRSEAKHLLTTARQLRQRYPNSDISISLPRLRDSHLFATDHAAAKALLQIIVAARLYEPSISIALSTREPAWVRDLLMPYGVTSASVASKTAPGGHQNELTLAQFAISDERSVDEFCQALRALYLMPVQKNWHHGIN
ncbi:radical SAM protein [Salinibius halmophilus]|uniref:radical SAM protein n=1 Tax=Salinibius halmophilus TaxID=1853216 RepID=UPI000E66D5BC|nr:radical SAM protein [Salinibius halmophilus]